MAADDPATGATREPEPAETAARRDASHDVPPTEATDRAELDRLRKALSEANRKAASDRKRLEELDRTDADRRAAVEVAERKAAELAAQLMTREMEIAVEREARTQGWPNPELAWRLVDRDRIRVDPETSKITGIKDAVEKVGKDYPSLVGGAHRGGGTPPREARRPGDGRTATGDDRVEDLLLRSGRYQQF